MKKLLQKKSFQIIAIALLLLLTGAIYFKTQATNFSWIQSGWLGGQSATTATHSTDANNTWANFSAKDSETSINGSGDAQLRKADTVTETTDADFNTNTSKDNTLAVSGNSIKLLKADGATCSVAGDCQSNACTGNLCVAAFACGTSTVNYGGQNYNTVQIGTQCWFRENLNVGTMLAAGTTIPSDPAPTPNDPNTVSKWCYSNSSAICSTDGGLYTWAEANGFSSSCNTTTCAPSIPNQGICPAGWHIPTDAEYIVLEEFLGMCSGTAAGCSGYVGARGTNQGTQIRTISPTTLSVLYAGDRATGGSFVLRNTNTYLWSASEESSSRAWIRYLDSADAARISRGYNTKSYGYSVRCIKD